MGDMMDKLVSCVVIGLIGIFVQTILLIAWTFNPQWVWYLALSPIIITIVGIVAIIISVYRENKDHQ